MHFLNNALAVFVLKNASELQQAARLNEAGEAGWPGILLAAVVLIPAVMSLWINRVEYRLSDETRWTPGYDTAAIPPDAAGASAVMEVRIRWLYGVGVLLCGGLDSDFGFRNTQRAAPELKTSLTVFSDLDQPPVFREQRQLLRQPQTLPRHSAVHESTHWLLYPWSGYRRPAEHAAR